MPPRTIRQVAKQNEIQASGKQSSQKKTSGGDKNKSKKNSPNQILKNIPTIAQPKCEMDLEIGLNRGYSSVYSSDDYGQLIELPALSSVTEDKFIDLLKQKMQQCRIVCDFVHHFKELPSKTLKQTYLQEILDHLSQPKFYKLMDQDAFKVLFTMIRSNIIRAIPPIPDLAKVPVIGDDIKDTIYESAWPHLELVYQIFQKTLESALFDPSVWEEYIDPSFISRFLLLFNASDQRERDALKMVLHRLYLKFLHKRVQIRQSIQNIFFTYMYETHYFSGINELLEIMISIINGYAVPLKNEHKDFLVRILLPLHTSHFLHLFHSNLFYCIMQYYQKDPSLIPVIVREMIKLWPISCSLKELIFLTELSKIIESISEEQFVDLMKPIFHKIGHCILSNHFQVSEAGMLLWKNDHFVQLTTKYAEDLFPIICPYLYKAGTLHWNGAIKNLAVSVIRICMQTSPSVFESYSKQMKQQESVEEQKTQNEKSTWRMIANHASSIDPELREVELPAPVDKVYS